MQLQKSLSLIIFLFICFQSNVLATVHRVNNTGADADFTSAQAAHDAANQGDTLYIEASPNSYGTLTISKEVHIFGTGYFLSNNLDLQATPQSSNLTQISLNTGCSNTTIQGLTVTYILSASTVVTFSDVTISRNLVAGIHFSSNNTISNIFINHNFLYGTHNSYGAISTGGTGSKTFVIANNIIEYNARSYISFTAQTFATLVNNTMNMTTINTTACVYQNNILLGGSFTAATAGSNSYNNNIGNSTQFPTGNGNQQNVDNSTICQGFPTQGSNTPDDRYILAGSSPASGAGISGEDCGAFGGIIPYTLSGIPPIPTIYKLVAPAMVNGNFNVTLSTRSNN